MLPYPTDLPGGSDIVFLLPGVLSRHPIALTPSWPREALLLAVNAVEARTSEANAHVATSRVAGCEASGV